MSKFWIQVCFGGYLFLGLQDGSESEEEESDSGEEEEEGPPEEAAVAVRRCRCDDDGDTRKRVIRPKGKCFEELYATVDQMKNAGKINDWISLLEGFDKMNKQLDEVRKVTGSEKPPNVYVRALVMLKRFLNRAMSYKEAKKKMSTRNAKAMNSMKGKLRKNNKQYADIIEQYWQDPDSFEDAVDVEESEEEDEDEVEEVDYDDIEILLINNHRSNR